MLSGAQPTPRRVSRVTLNDLRVGERVKHRGGVTYYSSRPPYHDLAEQLAISGEVFLIDLAGYGSAPDPKRDVSIQLHSQVLGTFLQRAGIENPVLVGRSMGTRVVSQLAFDAPEVSDRLVFIARTVNPPVRRFSTEAKALLRDITMESMRCNLIISTDYPVRTS